MSHQSELISQDILGYLKQHENKDLLRFLTCGNVDDGKSTLIGRLLYDSKLIYEDQLQAVTRDSKNVQKKWIYLWRQHQELIKKLKIKF